MTQAIQLGTVLGGRYKVTAQIVTTAAQDQVLDGKDQVLERKVSILVASAEHSDLLIENARDIATGSRSGSLQVLDLGQSDEVTYLITSHAPANDLLDLLLTESREEEGSENEELGGEIFGADSAPAATSSDYEQVGTVTSPQEEVAPDDAEETSPVTEWTDADYEAFGEEPPARRSSQSSQGGGTLFDRAATDVAGGSSAAAAASLRDEDSSYDGDNRYQYQDDDFAPAGDYGNYGDYDEPEEPYYDDDDEYYDDRPRRRTPAGVWITAAVVVILLVLLVIFGFNKLGSLVSGSSSSPSGTVSSAESGSESPSESQTSTSGSSAKPEVANVSRVIPDNPDFMSDQDSTLSKAFDGNPSSYWTSYGFSNPSFGQLIQGLGIAAELKEPTKVKQVTVNTPKSNGGQFTVYTSDSPSIDGATKAGEGSFSNGPTTVDLSGDAASKDAKYVIVYVTQLPQVSQPIGGYNYGLHVGEISAK